MGAQGIPRHRKVLQGLRGRGYGLVGLAFGQARHAPSGRTEMEIAVCSGGKKRRVK